MTLIQLLLALAALCEIRAMTAFMVAVAPENGEPQRVAAAGSGVTLHRVGMALVIFAIGTFVGETLFNFGFSIAG